MLQVGPWNRLPLTIRWLLQDYHKPLTKDPPIHMPVCFGPVVSAQIRKALKKNSKDSGIVDRNCDVCTENVRKGLTCLYSGCKMVCHVVCLARTMTEHGEYIPVQGTCPVCRKALLWGDVVRKYRGCYDETPSN